jgi:hypothetical protein
MKRLVAKEGEATNFQKDNKSIKEVEQTLKGIHEGMVEFFHVNFPYFSDVKILKHSEMLKQLIKRVRNDLEESGIIHCDLEWKQISKAISGKQEEEFFENLAFYNPQDDTLYFSEEIAVNYPEKMLSVCAHELSEKLLFTIASLPARLSMQSAVELYLKEIKNANTSKRRELLNVYLDAVFKTVFKEGCCEAIALQTLRSMGYETEVLSLEKELQTGCSKCIELMFHLENARIDANRVKKDGISHQVDDPKLVKNLLRSFLR